VFFAGIGAWMAWLIGGRDPGERGFGAHLDAQHVAGDAVRRRVLDLVLEEMGAGGRAGAIAALLIANPFDIRERAVSALSPHEGQTDSNGHRAELRRIGWEMIKAHPWLGVGPEQVSRQYQDYIRPDMPGRKRRNITAIWKTITCNTRPSAVFPPCWRCCG
jgi:hypothetical protein